MLRRWVSTPATFILPAVDADRANFYGLHGMHGVIWEWTSDFNSALVTGDSREDGGTNRQLFCGSGAVGTRDVSDSAAFMRFGLRSSLKASYTVHNLGFRCARTLP
jgi:formylglycine-generating enzyme required for sulfatase activity